MIPKTQAKAFLIAAAMVAAALALWLTDPDPFLNVHGIVCAAVMIAGAAAAILRSDRGLKDVLSFSCISIGIYLLLRFSAGMASDSDAHFIVGLALSMAGVAIFFFGFGLLGGTDYNLVRIRLVSGLVLAGAVLYLFSRAMQAGGPSLQNQGSLTAAAIAFLSFSVLAAAMDRTLGLHGKIASIRGSLAAESRRMRNVQDAYLLREDAERLVSAYGKENAREEAVLRSNSAGNRPIAVSVSGGKATVEITSGERVYADPAISMESVCAAIEDGTAVFFGTEGRRIAALVYDGIQEDMDNPKIFGRELDVRRGSIRTKKKGGDRKVRSDDGENRTG